MCEAKPGPRCATDTSAAAAHASNTYTRAYPDGPQVNPLTAAAASSGAQQQPATPTATTISPRDLTHQIRAQHPGVSTWLYRSSAGHVVLSNITVDEGQRGQGRGDAALKDITRAADQNGWTLALTADGGLGSSKKRLTAWYARHGFQMNKGRNRDFEISEAMYRLPKEPARV